MMADKPSPAVPKLRFAEFRNAGNWITKILSNQGRFLSSLTGKTARDFDTGDATFIPYMNVFSNTFTSIFDLRSVRIGRDESQNAVAKGDVFFTISSEVPEEAGMSSVLLDEIENCYLNSFCALFRFDDGKSPNPAFLGYLLRSALARAHLSRGAQGATRYNISKAIFRSLPLQLPSGPEQQRIADCLGSLDDLIAAEDRKLDALRRHKKGLMQRLFPQPGTTVPRLRFPEFRDAPHWTTGRCLDVARVHPGYGFPDKFQGNKTGQFPFYKVSDISRAIEDGKKYISEARNYIGSDVLNEIRGKPVPTGTIIFAKIGEAIRSNRRVITTEPAVIDNNTAGVKAIETKSSDEFLYYIWSSVSLIDHAGGVVPAVSKSTLENVPLCYPNNPEEQRRIADCLGVLDDLIAAEGQKLGTLRQHKQGLMQQLFPSPDGE